METVTLLRVRLYENTCLLNFSKLSVEAVVASSETSECSAWALTPWLYMLATSPVDAHTRN